MRIRPQNGLGDAVFAIPFVAAHVLCKVKVTVETKHGEVFKPFGDWVTIEPISKDTTVKELRYRQYGDPYFSRYFPKTAPTTFGAALRFSRDLYWNFADQHAHPDLPRDLYCVYAPPRAAARHKHFQMPEYTFQVAPTISEVCAKMPEGVKLVLVGQNEKFDPEYPFVPNTVSPNWVNFIDRLDLWQVL
jgi:hypothetical protein